MYTVYLDVLCILNFLIDFLLLSLTGRLRGRKCTVPRIAFGAAIGALSSLSIYLPPLHPTLLTATRLIFALAMSAAAFPFQSLFCLLKDWFAFFGVSFLTAGILYACFTVFDPQIMTIYNGVVYFDISAFLLIFNIAVAYLLVTLFDRLLRSDSVRVDYCEVTITMWGKSVTVRGLMDTGNSLRDLFTDTPVAVCHAESLKALLPEKLRTAVCSGTTSGLIEMMDNDTARKFRLIPYSGVHSGGLLPAFRADCVALKQKDTVHIIENVYIAFCCHSLGKDFDILLNPHMISVKTQRQVKTA